MTQFTGNTTLGNIDANQSIVVIDGSLTISGDIGPGAKITLENSQSSSNSIKIGKVVINNMESTRHKLIVQGNVHERAIIIAPDADLKFRGYVFDRVTATTYNGNISAKDLGRKVTLSTYNGNIATANVGSKSRIESYNGKVFVDKVSENAVVESYNADVSARSYDPSATIKTHNGKCCINGVCTETRARNQRSISINVRNIPSS